MKIAVDLIAAEYEPGGMLLVTRALLHGLSKIDQQNDYVVLTVRPDDYQELAKAPNVHIEPVTLPSRRGILIQHQMFAPLVLQRVKPDVLHIPAFAAPISWRGPLVTTIHDLAFIKVPEQSSLYARLYHTQLQRAGAQRADRVIAISEQTCAEIAEYWSVPEERIRLVYHALQHTLDVNSITPESVRKMQAKFGPRYLLHVGRIMPRKNVERLIEAFDLIAANMPDISLVLTGGLGYASEKAVQLIENSLYKERIHLAGWVADEDMASLIGAASVLVFPSKHEGQGMPTLEAMLCGTPAVASYEAASIEIAGNAVVRADCSTAPPLAEAITRVLTDEKLRSYLIQAGKKQAAKFRAEVCAEQTLAVYKEALEAYSLRHKQKVRVVS